MVLDDLINIINQLDVDLNWHLWNIILIRYRTHMLVSVYVTVTRKSIFWITKEVPVNLRGLELLSCQNGKLEANNKKVYRKSWNTWILSNIHKNNIWLKEETTREFRKYFELNDNEVLSILHIKMYVLQPKQYSEGCLYC